MYSKSFGSSGCGKTNALLQFTAKHLTEHQNNKVLYLVTEETPKEIGVRFAKYYPDVDASRLKVSDYRLGLSPVIPCQYTMLVIDDNGGERFIDTFVDNVLHYSPNVKVIRSFQTRSN